MTTAIYFFLMATTFFVVPQLIVKFLTNEVKYDKSLIYLVFAFCLPLVWVFLPKEVLTLREVNFIQHAVGGGVAVGFVAIYLIKNLRVKLLVFDYFIFQFIFVFALVSMLGVTNELLEFLLDTLQIGIFSSDRYDTWFDLMANTSGALSVFLLWCFLSKILRKKE